MMKDDLYVKRRRALPLHALWNQSRIASGRWILSYPLSSNVESVRGKYILEFSHISMLFKIKQSQNLCTWPFSDEYLIVSAVGYLFNIWHNEPP